MGVKLFIRSALCTLGVHGPNWYGNKSRPTSYRDPDLPFNRSCTYCGERWYGTQVYGRTRRYLGDWKTKEQLIETGEWQEIVAGKEKA